MVLWCENSGLLQLWEQPRFALPTWPQPLVGAESPPATGSGGAGSLLRTRAFVPSLGSAVCAVWVGTILVLLRSLAPGGTAMTLRVASIVHTTAHSGTSTSQGPRVVGDPLILFLNKQGGMELLSFLNLAFWFGVLESSFVAQGWP